MSRQNKTKETTDVVYKDWDGRIMSREKVAEHLMMYGKYPKQYPLTPDDMILIKKRILK